MVTANGSTPGTFEVTMKDGKKAQSVLNADGTYVDRDASGKETGHGSWNVTDGKTCFDPEGNEVPNVSPKPRLARMERSRRLLTSGS